MCLYDGPGKSIWNSEDSMTAANQQEMYDRKYVGEEWNLVKLRPDALSTTRYDGTARLLRSESTRGSMLDIGCEKMITG